MSNKKGFTLIELIVTIAVMLSILTIAIVSFIGISNKKKQESYNAVKNEIITAAEEYFENNSFYKETLTNNNYIKVSLGKLVNEDYINVVTNPITGKKLNECNYVKVIKNKNNNLDFSFIDDELDCSLNSYIELVELSSPKLDIEVIGKLGNDNWYIYNTDENPGPAITVSASDEKSGISGGIQIKTSDGYAMLETYPKNDSDGSVYAIDKSSYSATTELKGKEVCYRAVNNSGASRTKCINLKVDIDFPNCSVQVIGILNGTEEQNGNLVYKYKQYGTNSLFSLKPIIKLRYSDNGSGINNSSIKIKQPESDFTKYSLSNIYYQEETNSGAVLWQGKLKDKAGNENSCNKYILVEQEETLVENIINNTEIKYCGETTGESTAWTNSNRTITQEFKNFSIRELTSSTKKQTYTSTTKTATISDGTTACLVNVYVDKEKPYYDKTIFEHEGYVRLKQWDKNGNEILNTEIKVQKENNKYTAQACVKNILGTMNVSGYTTYAKDDDSGINKNSWEKYRTYYSLNKNNWIGAQCLRTQNDNPCIMYDHIYVSDNAGNKSDDLGRLEVKIGYIGIDEGC